MQNFLDLERRDLNSMLKQSINSFLEAKNNNRVKCECGNTENFKIIADKNLLLCKICNMEIKLDEKAVQV